MTFSLTQLFNREFVLLCLLSHWSLLSPFVILHPPLCPWFLSVFFYSSAVFLYSLVMRYLPHTFLSRNSHPRVNILITLSCVRIIWPCLQPAPTPSPFFFFFFKLKTENPVNPLRARTFLSYLLMKPQLLGEYLIHSVCSANQYLFNRIW